ncbi:hypothetical protein GCM10027416_30900 [Okibacterium endophyticum]
MDLTQYTDELRRQLEVAAAAGGDDARALAERLTAPLEASSRLVLLEALSAAAGEITRELAPGSIDVRLRGRDPEFVVTLPATSHFDEVTAAEAPPSGAAAEAPATDVDDTSTTRTTLRLPDQLKQRAEEAASREGISVNSWLVRAVSAALDTPKGKRPIQREPSAASDHFTGWVR